MHPYNISWSMQTFWRHINIAISNYSITFYYVIVLAHLWVLQRQFLQQLSTTIISHNYYPLLTCRAWSDSVTGPYDDQCCQSEKMKTLDGPIKKPRKPKVKFLFDCR